MMILYRITYTYTDGDVWRVTTEGTQRQAFAHVMRTKRFAARKQNPVIAYSIEAVTQ